MTPASRACRQCGNRWAQSKDRLCRTCAREAGDRRTTIDRERERLAREPPPRCVPERPPIVRRTVTIAHCEYVVMWDGSMDGAIARGLSL